ncbi:MAG: glutamate racemase [Desulfobacteraceae bacterium]|nr:glutamate racemase [Desulfobacteraceae bacterium]
MIGVFDSGIGGLTVVKALKRLSPSYPILYLGDTARTPYGSKSKRTIIKYSLKNAEFLVRQGARIIVIACNTASSCAPEAIRERFGLPVFEVIGPGAQAAVKVSRKQRIGVIGTRATIVSKAYEQRIQQIQPNAKVYGTPCPLLVPLVEEGWLSKPETAMIIKKYLHPLKNLQIDTLILGCTHYPVLKQLIQRKIGSRVVLVDSAEAAAEKVHAYLRNSGNHSGNHLFDRKIQPESRIFITDTTEQFCKTARLILKDPIPMQIVDL